MCMFVQNIAVCHFLCTYLYILSYVCKMEKVLFKRSSLIADLALYTVVQLYVVS